MSYDGAQYSARVDGTTQRQLYTKVVDQVLNSPAYAARLIGSGEPFEGKTMDITMDVTADTQGQWFTGLETLNSSATNTTITTSYAQTAFTFPVVSIMLDSFANVGSLGVINIDTFKYEKGAAQALQAIGSAAYGTGTANQMHGLESINDNGTNAGSIGGQSRTTYAVLDNGYQAAATSNKLTLSQMATAHDGATAAGMTSEAPNFGMTTKTVWSLYEQLLAPNIRTSYDEVGYDRVLMRSKYGQRNSADLRNSGGFTALSYRDMHIGKDDFCTPAVLYFNNEDYIKYHGRTEVPEEYKDILEHVDFGEMSAYEGTGAEALKMPSAFHGWYYQKPMLIPEQAGRISRFYVIGNTIGHSFRRQSKITAITSV